MSKGNEERFQQDIINALVQQGWLVGESRFYDPNTALYTEDLLAYVKEAWPKTWERIAQNNPLDPEKYLIQQTVRQLQRKGTLEVLRHGFKVPAAQVNLCGFKPDHQMNPDTEKRYELNRLRVVPELSYSPHTTYGQVYNPRLDLVLFVNGIPTATLELKSDFKQSTEHAKRQYKNDRPVKDPITRKDEPLLVFKRGALVHFAVTQQEVAMTTKLAGKETFFLPFNQGTDEGAKGNPAPKDENTYATAYLWEYIFNPDQWLKILGRFLHLEQQVSENFNGRRHTKETMIFPRYHQWDVVNQLIANTHQEGPGQRYLVQHSAGSGKSNSIAWTAHQLAQLYDKENKRLFSSIIVVTDRTVLDNQLQQTIYQFEHAQGVVCPITRDLGNQSKSKQLAEALMSQARIIIVTIQTFPALFEILDEYPQLAKGHYAVIADEAHSSQTGAEANKLRSILSSLDNQEERDEEEISAEDLLDAALSQRRPSENISYYAFTATPKAKTIELFGRLPNPELPPSEKNKPEAFHVYSMRQAIEEGFILDVLKNYTTYSVAYKLAHPDADKEEVDTKQAVKTIAKWVKLHPHNINQKVEIIVEHFRENVRYLLDGQAKAMVVTGSRQEAVRYQLAMQAYIKDQGYQDVYPLVAFSGTVYQDGVIPTDVTETSNLLNQNLHGRDFAEAFNTADFNVMIVANKYQTGFDQPKLCAMYVDKKLSGVACVQTLSRLNRIFPGKDQTFILDFFNEEQDILDAFLPYYKTSALTDVTTPEVIFDLKDTLDEAQIYYWQEVDNFALAFFNPKAQAASLLHYCRPAQDRYLQRMKLLKNERQELIRLKAQAEQSNSAHGIKKFEYELEELGKELNTLALFKKNLSAFVRTYEFLSQIVSYEDADLEKLCVYAKHLIPLLKEEFLDEELIDISELELTHYRITKNKEQKIRLEEEQEEYTLDPMSAIGSAHPRDSHKEKLSAIIEQLNEIFGGSISDDDQLRYAENIRDRLMRDSNLVQQIENHTPQQIMRGLFPSRLNDIVIDDLADHEQLSTEILSNQESKASFTGLILKMMLEKIADNKTQIFSS